jgi:hypothetical protein
MSIFWWPLGRGAGSSGLGAGPTTPSISISGTTLTVASSSSDATNTVWYTASTYLGGGTWTSDGSRTGDGNVTLSLTAGTYLIQVQSVRNQQTAVTNVLLYVVTATTTSIYYQVLQAVQSAIQGLNLVLPDASVLPASRVYLYKLLTDRAITLPCVIVFQPPVPETMPGGTNERDDTGYPVGVGILAASNQDYDLDSDDDPFIKWRQRIRRKFNEQRIVVDQVYRCLWEPSPLIDYGLWEQGNLWVQGGIVRVLNRESRDTSA